MKPSIIFPICLAFLLGSNVFAKVAPLRLNRSVDFAPVDSIGALDLTCKIESKSQLDLVLNFNSKRNVKTELGAFWRLGVASSHLFKDAADKTIIFLPNGRRFDYFQPASKARESNHIPMQLYFDEVRKEHVFYDQISNRYVFSDGLLRRAKIKGKRYKWEYQGRVCIAVVSLESQKKIFKFNYHRTHKFVRSFEVSSQKYTLKYAQTESKIPYLTSISKTNKTVFNSRIRGSKQESKLSIVGIDDRFSFNKKGIVSHNGDKVVFKVEKHNKSFKRIRGGVTTHEVTEAPRYSIYTTPEESIRTDFLITRKGKYVRKIYSLMEKKVLKEFFYDSSYKMIRALDYEAKTGTVYKRSSNTLRQTLHYADRKLIYTVNYDSSGKKISKEFASGLKIKF